MADDRAAKTRQHAAGAAASIEDRTGSRSHGGQTAQGSREFRCARVGGGDDPKTLGLAGLVEGGHTAQAARTSSIDDSVR